MKVENIKYCKEGIYIGRRNGQLAGSPLANKFKIDLHTTRMQAISLYKRWLWEQMQIDTPALRELLRIKQLNEVGNVTLLCWCKPLPCHGDVIISAIDWLNKQDID